MKQDVVSLVTLLAPYRVTRLPRAIHDWTGRARRAKFAVGAAPSMRLGGSTDRTDRRDDKRSVA